MKVTFRKVNENKKSEDQKDKSKPIKIGAKTSGLGRIAKDAHKFMNSDKSKRVAPEKKHVKESNDFIPQGPDGLNDDLSDKDRQIQLAATHNTENPVAEGVLILSFEQFINEAEDFQAQFAPGDAEAQEAEDDSDIATAEAPEISDEDEDGQEPENDDNWYIDGNDDSGEEGEGEIGAPEEGGDDMYSIQNELTSINAQITDMLKQYQDGGLNVQQYKEKASPLLAKRKDLQAKLDKTFSMSLGGDEGVGEEGTPDGNLRF